MTSESESPTATDERPEDTLPEHGTADSAAASDDRSTRGTTVIDDRVRRRLVEHAVLTVPGAVRNRAIATRSLPATHFETRDRQQLQIDVAAQWPYDSSQLVSGIETAVRGELERSLGEQPESLHVHIARISDDGDAKTAVAQLFTGDAEPTDDAVDIESADAEAGAVDDKGLIPRRAAGSSYVAVPVLLAILVLGAIAVRDTAITIGWAHGTRWIDAALGIADDVRWDWWTWPGLVAAMIVGLVLVVIAVKPRRRSHAPVSDGVYLSKRFAREQLARGKAES